MRKSFDRQKRFDSQAVLDVRLNLNCRDEIIPILKALQHIYSQPKLRDDILGAIAEDVNRTSSRKWGRQGMDYRPNAGFPGKNTARLRYGPPTCASGRASAQPG
jgi:hypothetical protein